RALLALNGACSALTLPAFAMRMGRMGYPGFSRSGGGQWIGEIPRWRKDSSRTVAVVHVAINGHGAGDLAVLLHAPDGDRDVVDHAEAFAVVRMGVMESAADIEGDAVAQRALCSQNGASC